MNRDADGVSGVSGEGGGLGASQNNDEAADREFLSTIINGTGDVLGDDTSPRLEPMFDRYPEGTEMRRLLERAGNVFADAAIEFTYWQFAGQAIDDAKKKAGFN